MKVIRWIYKVIRSILFSTILAILAIFAIIYIALSIPAVENKIRDVAQSELSAQLGSKVEIEKLSIYPFNEIVLSKVTIFTPAGDKLAEIKKLGAGISIYSLLTSRKFVFTYAELIGLKANISQDKEDGPLNIDFIIDLIIPQEKKEPPTKFDLELRSIVIRDSDIGFDRLWKSRSSKSKFDPDHFKISGLKADITCPRIKNDDFIIDLRRMSLNIDHQVFIDKLSFVTHITPTSISVKDFNLRLPGTNLSPADINLSFTNFKNIKSAFSMDKIALVIINNHITPSDLAYFYPQLNEFSSTYTLDIDIEGNLQDAVINRLEISSPDKTLYLNIKGQGVNFNSVEKLALSINALNLNLNKTTLYSLCSFIPSLSPKYFDIITNIGNLAINGKGAIDLYKGEGKVDLSIDSDPGYIDLSGQFKKTNKKYEIIGNIDIPVFNIGEVLNKNTFGDVAMNAECSLNIQGDKINGEIISDIERIHYNGINLNDLHLEVGKAEKMINFRINSHDPMATLSGTAGIILDGPQSEWTGKIEIENLVPSAFGIMNNFDNYKFHGELDCKIQGNSIDTFTGNIYGHNLWFGNEQKELKLTSLFIQNNFIEGFRSFRCSSDWFDIKVDGDYRPSLLPSQFLSMIQPSLPSIIRIPHSYEIPDLKIDIDIKDDTSPFKFFNSPLLPLSDITITGNTDKSNQTANIYFDAPYLLKGNDKIIRNTGLNLKIDVPGKTTDLTLQTLMPVKHGDAWINLDFTAHDNLLTSSIGWKGRETDLYKGNIIIDTKIESEELLKNPNISLKVHPTDISINGADWNVGEAYLGFKDNILSIDNLSIRHLDQYINIEGTASSSSADSVRISLADMDLGFIFDTLAIKNVTFGGSATGEIEGSALFSSSPKAFTKGLYVKNLSYNDAILGDGDISASWINNLKKISLKADVAESGKRVALVDGGIFLGKDSLSFDFNTDKVNVAFLQPFMKTFSSYVEGKASGKAKLFGTFIDVDLIGNLHVDTLSLKLDPTNVTYSTSGDVEITQGRIHIPPLRLYDKYGNTGTFSGDLSHNFFHDASFDFKLTDARKLLCYDTNDKINPVWYGTFFCNGNANIHGDPGLVAIDVEMATAPGTLFTFVLNDTQVANDYSFLTFSDRSKEEVSTSVNDSIPYVVREIANKVAGNIAPPSIFTINLQVSTTPGALMTLIMDPASGDKIKARGSGPININYNSFTDNLSMYGKYTLDEGTYNFTLQDIFIRDFNISPGSTVSFNGNPMNAMLDISALYRVNTNLTDLDKSFSTDRELNRTNVPVDACLYVKGDLESPSISFDIQLPTLTSDMERKVKSIISTDDMMNRQILYLLALNRFYTPEYMGLSSDGTGELASVASSTLSTQFSRMLGSLTDKVSVSPSFRSDRGDFSDFEMDVALSSRLLDNRLLLNGNFGYRDRKTSQTTFVGDFDIEYLLSKNGNLRLKAYNHFNDQNYYLKSALTTQGLGIVYRKDFNNPFTFLRRKRKGNK